MSGHDNHYNFSFFWFILIIFVFILLIALPFNYMKNAEHCGNFLPAQRQKIRPSRK
jgi:hypothetical protein